MSDDIILPPNTPPARRCGKQPNLVALIQASLRPLDATFRFAGWCEALRRKGTVTGGLYSHYDTDSVARATAGVRLSAIDDAKKVHQILSPVAVQITQAIKQFESIIKPDPKDEIDPTLAAAMVKGLFNAIVGKKKSEEDQVKQEACTAMFNPMIAAIGVATGSWREVPRHPVVLSLAINSMIYKTQVFSPAPLELAQACRREHAQLCKQLGYMQTLIEDLDRAQEILSDHVGDENLVVMREIINKNGCAPLTAADVQVGEPVPDGVIPLSPPPALIERFPLMAAYSYFITPRQIVFVENNKCAEIFKRFDD